MGNKMKSHKGIRKRFRLTARGKVKHTVRAGAGHLMSGKNAKRRRRITSSDIVTGEEGKLIRTYYGKESK